MEHWNNTLEVDTAMRYRTYTYPSLSTQARLARLVPEGGVAEYNMMVTVTDACLPFALQLEAVEETLRLVRTTLPPSVVPVFKRYFLSDAANQHGLLPEDEPCAVSVVEQAPLNGSKIALWIWLQQDMTLTHHDNGLYEAAHGEYRHLWRGSMAAPGLQSEVATMAIFDEYKVGLEKSQASLKDNCVRTWLFVQNVDVNYGGVVRGRNEVFRCSGLTPDTHFIASTGIAGRHPNKDVTVEMDAYAVAPLKEGQMSYLYARDFLNPTMEYGVAFERGACVDYGDRRHVFISGTASINNRGEVMHEGDVHRQADRMLANVEALLSEAGCGRDDMAYIILYLRDIADYKAMALKFDALFPKVPIVIVHAPVCRPGWLIEMECMAMREVDNPAYAPL